MATIKCSCPRCGLPVLLIVGRTLVKDKGGQLVLRCPWCEK